MSDDSPELVSLPAAFDLDEFPSEAASPACETTGAPPPVAAPPQVAITEIKPADPPAAPAEHSAPAPDAPPTGLARVAEFPVPRPHFAAANTSPAAPGTALSAVNLVELLERQGGLDWRHAVSVVHQICLQLKGQESHNPILLEARNILITQQGDVRLLPGQPGGDPLVIQLGRLLRTMLMGNDAPPELRLLLAQATFELPIFQSIEDVDRALQQLERVEIASGETTGFAPPLPMPPAEPPEVPNPRPSMRTILPSRTPYTNGRRARRRSLFGGQFAAHGARVTLAVAVVVVAVGIVLNRPGLLWPATTAAPSGASTPPVNVSSAPISAPESTARAGEPPPSSVVPQPILPSHHTAASSSAVPLPDRRRTVAAEPPLETRATVVPGRSERSSPRPAVTATTGIAASPRESERRAASLMAQGQTTEAAMAFDALVLANPLYEPMASALTPESLAAFRSSQRTLLPGIAVKTYERAKTALASGDPERALSLARDANAILDRSSYEPQPQLREQLQDIVTRAGAAKIAADDIVYSENDRGIVPPRALSRGFPDTPPIGVPPYRVGTLEMIIDRDGNVDKVKLHTPLNRYHERMVVSAAKNWRYLPATKDGRPVKCRITVKINLPESGTE
jgi:hypothetical protein